MVLNKETDPIMLALQNEIKTKQSMIDQLTEENNYQTMLIDQLRHDLKAVAVTVECERPQKQQSAELLKELKSEGQIDAETVKALIAEVEQLREINAVLVSAMKEERGAGGDHSSSAQKRRLCREEALLYQRKALEDSHKVLQKLMARDIIKRGMEYAFKHSVCLVKSEGGVDSESDEGSDHDGSGGGDNQSLCVERMADVSEVDSCAPRRKSPVAQQFMAGVKQVAQVKDTPKQEAAKQAAKEKGTPKPVSEVKEVPKPITKEPPNPIIKELVNLITMEPPKPITKEPPKPITKEPPKPITKEPPKPITKEPPKPITKEPPKPITKEPPKPIAKEPPKPITKEPPKPITKEPPKPITKEPPKPITKEPPKPVTKEPPKPISNEPPHSSGKDGAKEVKQVAVPQKKDAREELRTKVAAALKENVVDDSKRWEVDKSLWPSEHQVDEQFVTQVKETTNLEVKVTQKPVAKEGLGTKKPVPVAVAQEPIVYNISDCILRKKCFDDEEVVDEVDEDIEKLIMETYSKKVTFDEDVQEAVIVEEEEVEESSFEYEYEDGQLGEVKSDTVDNANKVPTPPVPEEEEEEEFLSTDDEDEGIAEEKKEEVMIVGEIGQFRKKTFDDEEVINEVDPDVELMIIRTYATFVTFGEDE